MPSAEALISKSSIRMGHHAHNGLSDLSKAPGSVPGIVSAARFFLK